MRIIEQISDEPITKKDLSQIEDMIKSTLPDAYVEFLLKNNGGRPHPSVFIFMENEKKTESNIQCFYGISDNRNYDLTWNIELFSNRIISGFVPIACDSFGNQILLSIRDKDKGSIWFWDHELEEDEPSMANMHIIENSFNAFLENLFDY